MGKRTNVLLTDKLPSAIQERKGYFNLHMLLVYNRVKQQWCTQRKKVCFFSNDDRFKIVISTVINAICNMSSLNVVCAMLVGCNSISDWKSFAKLATLYGHKI